MAPLGACQNMSSTSSALVSAQAARRPFFLSDRFAQATPVLSTRYPALSGLGARRPAPQPRSVALPALIGLLGASDLSHRRAPLIYPDSEPLPRRTQSPRAPTYHHSDRSDSSPIVVR